MIYRSDIHKKMAEVWKRSNSAFECYKASGMSCDFDCIEYYECQVKRVEEIEKFVQVLNEIAKKKEETENLVESIERGSPLCKHTQEAEFCDSRCRDVYQCWVKEEE